MINVCLGTACYVKGADRIAEKIMSELGIRWGETTKDGVFTLEAARCLGACGLAPIVMIGEEVHGQVTPDQVPRDAGEVSEAGKGGVRGRKGTCKERCSF